jgi:hypothetical protein
MSSNSVLSRNDGKLGYLLIYCYKSCHGIITGTFIHVLPRKKVVFMRVPRLKTCSRHGGARRFFKFAVTDPATGAPCGVAALLLIGL